MSKQKNPAGDATHFFSYGNKEEMSGMQKTNERHVESDDEAPPHAAHFFFVAIREKKWHVKKK